MGPHSALPAVWIIRPDKGLSQSRRTLYVHSSTLAYLAHSVAWGVLNAREAVLVEEEVGVNVLRALSVAVGDSTVL